MKKIPLIIALALSLIGCAKQDSTVLSDPDSEYELSYSDTDIVLSQKDALGFVEEEFMNMNTDIWVSKNIVPASTVIHCLYSEIPAPKYDSWLVFINLEPYALWTHDCLFRFVSVADGKVTDIIGKLPPPIEMMDVVKQFTAEELDHISGGVGIEKQSSLSQQVNQDFSKWAVIICGGNDMIQNYRCFWNDCSRIYNILVYQYHYPESQIFILMSDGTDPGLDRNMLNYTYTSSPIDLDGNGTTDIDYSLTKANISSAFNSIRDNASNGDDVFVYVLTHGDDEDRNILLWNPTGSLSSSYRFTPTDMIGELNKIQNTNIDIVMGQCHSGTFITPLHGYCRSITTACKAEEKSWTRPQNDYSAFYYRWCTSIEGQTPDGTTVNADTNQDGHVSFWEAYNYSSLNAPSNETPQYQECTTLAGYNYGLEGELFSLPTLSGPNNIDNNNYGTYYLSNVCPGTSAVNWQFSEFLTQSSATNSYAVVMPTNTNVIALGQTVTAILTLPDRTASLKKENITCWMSGHIFSNSLIVGAVSESGGRVTLENPYPGVSYYYWDSDVFTPEYQSLYFTDLTLNPGSHISDESYISVAFTDYFGNPVTIIRMLNQ